MHDLMVYDLINYALNDYVIGMIILINMIDLIIYKTGLSREDSYMLCSLAGNLRVTQTVNGNKGIHMMIKKSLLETTL